MKFNFNKVLSFILSFIILIGSFSYYSITAYALPKRLKDGTWIDVPVSEYGEEISYFIQYGVNQIGAVYNKDFETWLKNNDTYKDLYDDNGRLAKNISIDTETETVSYTEDIMSLLKSALDDYAKENEPYYMVNTLTLDDCAGNPAPNSKLAYDTAKNLLADSPSGIIAFGFYYSVPTKMFFTDVGHDFTNVSPVKYYENKLFVQFYDNETWNLLKYPGYEINLNSDSEAIKTAEEFKERADMTYQNQNIGKMFRVYPEGNTPGTFPYDCRNANGWLNLITKERRRIRVFNSFGDFQNYTLGKRHVYYTSKYYDYTPVEISVSTKELEQSVNDLNTAMDKLLEQIDKDTPESDIENLLQQILDELKNSDSGGGGGGEGPGTDTPDTGSVDMSTTNSWLAKIYAKVCEIFDRMGQKDTPDQGSVSENSIGLSDINNVLKLIWANTNVIVEKLMPDDGVSGNSIDLSHTNSILDNIKAGLDDIRETLKKIKRWTVVDTIVDGADAIADWFDMIHGLISDADSGAESVVSTLSSALGDSMGLLKTKFPFSIPWDILFFVTALSAEPEVPQFSIPFDFEISALDLEVHYDLELDFTPFQWLSDLSRLLLSMTYAVGLMKLTFNVSTVEKEG